jgi:hypothetical protein
VSEKKSETIQQAELARLKAELAAAEARAALARAEAEAAITSAALARAEAGNAQAEFEPHDSAVALADPPRGTSRSASEDPERTSAWENLDDQAGAADGAKARNGSGSNGSNGTSATNGNGKHAAPAPPPLKDRKPSMWRDTAPSATPPIAPSTNDAEKSADVAPTAAEVKSVATEAPAEVDDSTNGSPAKNGEKKASDKQDSAAKLDAKTKAKDPEAKQAEGNPKTKAAAKTKAKTETTTESKSKSAATGAKAGDASGSLIPVVEDKEEEEKAPTFFERLLGKYAVACISSVSFSVIVHMVFLICLGLWFLPPLLKPSQELTAMQDLTPQEMVNQTLDTNMTPTSELALTSSSMVSSLSGAAGKIEGVQDPSIDQKVVENSEGPSVRVSDIERVSGRGKSLNMDLPEGAKGEPAAIVEDYQQAMDRITQEILLKLSKGKVLVVWCLDESESMKDDIKEIRQRIDKVYAELGLNSAAQGDSLLTSVISYGGRMNVHTKQPTSDIERIRAAMDEVTVDASGLEMQCQTVGYAINNYRGFVTAGKRQMMLVLVTDESGNQDENMQFLEPTIAEAKAARCPIYVLGRESVFGYPYAHMWTSVTVPAVGGGTVSRSWLLPIDRGPETPFVEQLQTDGFHRRQDAHPSGFGPYEQVRMARETGGVFFMLPSPEVATFDRDRVKDRKYELEKMRPYMADLSSRQDYANERDKHPDRATIWKVINDLNPYKPEIARHIDMRMSFSPEPPAFATQVHAELQKSIIYYKYLGAAEKALEDLRKQRNREPLPRWQANYDLISAQLLAYEARLWEYGAYLEAFIKTPKQFDAPKPDRQISDWRIGYRQKRIGTAMAANSTESSDRRAAAEKNEALIARSKAAFEAVIKDHEGTPWAARAEVELKRGFGVELNAHYYNPLYRAPVPAQPIVQPKL